MKAEKSPDSERATRHLLSRGTFVLGKRAESFSKGFPGSGAGLKEERLPRKLGTSSPLIGFFIKSVSPFEKDEGVE